MDREGTTSPETDLLRRRAQELEEALRRVERFRPLEEKYATIFEFAPVPIAMSSARDGLYFSVNSAFERVTRFRREELIGRSSLELGIVRPEDRAAAAAALRERGSLSGYEMAFRTRDGEQRVGLFSAEALQVGDEALLLTSLIDITDLKRSEGELRQARDEMEDRVRRRTSELARANATLQEAEEQFRTVAETAPVAIVILQDERFVYLNPHAGRLLAAPGGAPWARVLAEDRDTARAYVEAHLRDESPSRIELRIRREDGDERCVEVDGGPIRFRGRPAVLLSAYDVTARKREARERELYLHTITHDLRSPLSVVNVQAQALLRAGRARGVDPLIRSRVDAILRGARRMDLLLQDLVDTARQDGGQLLLDKRRIELASFFRDELDLMKSVIDMRRVEVELPRDLPAVEADPARLDRVFLNLLSNALKYSPPGSPVRLGARRVGDEVVVSVSDRGPGIPEGDLPHIFDRFHRVERTRKIEGVGLGLYITRTLVEAHGGRLWVESKVGQGSTFSFSLPVAS